MCVYYGKSLVTRLNLIGIGIISLLLAGLSACNIDNYNVTPVVPGTKKIHVAIKSSANLTTGDLTKIQEIHYYENGKVESEYHYYEDGATLKSESTYDYKTPETAKETLIKYSSNGDVSGKTFYGYTFDQGKIKERLQLDSNNTPLTISLFDYDLNGNLLQQIDTNYKTGSVVTIDYINLYKDGVLVQRETKVSGGNNNNSQSSVDNFHYSQSQGAQKVDVVSTDFKGSTTKVTYIMNDEGYIGEEITTDENNKIVKRYVYTYEYF